MTGWVTKYRPFNIYHRGEAPSFDTEQEAQEWIAKHSRRKNNAYWTVAAVRVKVPA